MRKNAKKRDILPEKRDGGRKRDFPPESGNVDTYGYMRVVDSVAPPGGLFEANDVAPPRQPRHA